MPAPHPPPSWGAGCKRMGIKATNPLTRNPGELQIGGPLNVSPITPAWVQSCEPPVYRPDFSLALPGATPDPRWEHKGCLLWGLQKQTHGPPIVGRADMCHSALGYWMVSERGRRAQPQIPLAGWGREIRRQVPSVLWSLLSLPLPSSQGTLIRV